MFCSQRPTPNQKIEKKSYLFKLSIVFIAGFAVACAKTPAAGTTNHGHGPATDAHHLQNMLDQDGQRIEYDTLMQLYEKITRPPRPIMHLDHLISQLIHQRNPNPRVDQMILIFAARIIGQSTVPIAGTGALFVSILGQEDRLNDWVLAFVADAIANYPFDLPEGDEVMDLVGARLDVVRAKDRSREEHFGYHFLPPPKSKFIRDYINSTRPMRTRMQERNRYYRLVKGKIQEKKIEAAMMYLKKHGAPISGAPCPLLLQCLSDNLHLLPLSMSDK